MIKKLMCISAIFLTSLLNSEIIEINEIDVVRPYIIEMLFISLISMIH